MRTLLILSFLALSVGVEACLGQERKVLMPEQVADDRPEGEATVAFRVVDVELVKGPIKIGQPPYAPISLQAAAQLRDRRNKLYVVLVGAPEEPKKVSGPFFTCFISASIVSADIARKMVLTLTPFSFLFLSGGRSQGLSTDPDHGSRRPVLHSPMPATTPSTLPGLDW